MIHQSGCFTIHGSDETPLDSVSGIDSDSHLMKRVTILHGDRDRIRNDLRMLFINDYSIFPDLTGMALHLEKTGSLYSVSEKEPKR